jgi:methionine synthase II (cobalamin-independent)
LLQDPEVVKWHPHPRGHFKYLRLSNYSVPIEKTVVGSFPKSSSPIDKAIREVVDLQLYYGIDVVTDGEPRTNMIQYFEQIPGIERLGDGLRIVGKIKPLERNKIDEFYKIRDYSTVKSILESLGKRTVKVKITITGPMTLGTLCALADMKSTSEHYDLEDEETLYSDFSHALSPLAERALNIGAYVQIDEPLLSTGKVSLESTKTILKDFVSRLPAASIEEEKVSLHACGSIKSVPNLYDILLDSAIPILSLGFSGEEEKENLEIISRASLEEHRKKLGVGFISNINVEDEKTIIKRYNKIEENAGRQNIRYIHPDCGFRMTPPKKVRLILEKMKIVADTIV